MPSLTYSEEPGLVSQCRIQCLNTQILKKKTTMKYYLNILFSPDTEDMQFLQEVKGERGDREQEDVESVAYS